ncbi:MULTISPECIES: copper chaperone PCu(A)C [Pseudomonas]|uniref:copper chaperone PCu(A)C n=1 Tax=Pseudomonas TaxID=286 RepID=UPI001AE5AF04|nr:MULTISPECIES: copper chaperone PCu(A)C [unclassified Pseudomonas]WHH50722.1 copper chaperone PCu(A)C [Pseudomonas sp. Ap32]HDS1695888.1 copper chaperone PCu(A)C [Pseudomonas putida]MBP2270682.1 copper(I)-binding protein [Pseudomonas sp. BP6]MBP2285035.1 copper(I)-binding protein [Pseudomonas sp. BP7]HDS1701110.1 copper chaperone PCu(A)C [Pseudomonas putida]
MSMQPIKRGLTALVLMGLALPALAQTTVSDAWVRASVPHQQSTGAFMVLTASSDSKLVGVASPVAKTVQVHEMTMNGDVMGMREVKAVELPAGKAVTLDPNGLHVMLMGLHNQVKEGEKVPLTLTIEDAKGAKETLEVQAQVRALNAEAGGGHDHMHMNH